MKDHMVIHPAIKKEAVSCYRWVEGKTATGQLVSFTVPSKSEAEDKVTKAEILAALAKIRNVEPPQLHKTNVTHGGYGRYSRFDIKQHKYAGGHGGYIEAIVVGNAPDEKHSIILHRYSSSYGSRFTEFKTVETLLSAWENCFVAQRTEIEKLQGFIREVECGILDPWFYAVGDQEITSDFVFPSAFYDHPVYRVGRKFIVQTDDFPSTVEIKTCMGAIETDTKSNWDHKVHRVLEVYWSDGTKGGKARALEADEEWIDEAIQQFKQLLSGAHQRFEIPFVDGSKFIGSFTDTNSSETGSGLYDVKVIAEKNGKQKESHAPRLVFKPSPECKTILAKLLSDAHSRGYRIVKILKCKKHPVLRGKWKGVYVKSDSCL
jgi:hypothetical protein